MTCVINYDAAGSGKDYVHRHVVADVNPPHQRVNQPAKPPMVGSGIGRTGRAGQKPSFPPLGFGAARIVFWFDSRW